MTAMTAMVTMTHPFRTVLIAALAATAAACSPATAPAELTAPAATEQQPAQQRSVEADGIDESPPGDSLDERSTADLLLAYAPALERTPVVIAALFDADTCAAFLTSDYFEYSFWTGFFDPDTGFWSTAPDELQYILTEDEIKAYVRPMIVEHCSGVS